MYKYEVTIGIPIFNVEQYVRRTLDSALSQTHKSIEFLICDDASTDSSTAIVEEYQREHPRGRDIRLIRQPVNLGVGNTRNCILEETQGKYLFFLDADDELLPRTIERMYLEAEKTNAELIHGSHFRVEEWRKDGKTFLYKYPNHLFLSTEEFTHFVYSKYDAIQVPVWNVLMRVEFLNEINMHFPPINFWEDFAVTMFLPTQTRRVGLLSDVTYIYHCRYGSLSHFQKRSYIPKQEIQSVIDALSKLKFKSLKYKQQENFSQMYKKMMMTFFYMACSILRQNDIISPAYTNREIRDIMKSPLSIGEVFCLRKARWTNLILCILGSLPSVMSVFLMKWLAYRRRLI